MGALDIHITCVALHLFSVLGAVCRAHVHHEVCRVQLTVCYMQCTLYSGQCAVCIVQCAVFYCLLFSVQFAM